MTGKEAFAALQAALSKDAETVPAGYLTTKAWAEYWGCAETSAGRLVRNAVTAGAMDVKVFKVKTTGRGIYGIPHYKTL